MKNVKTDCSHNKKHTISFHNAHDESYLMIFRKKKKKNLQKDAYLMIFEKKNIKQIC